jgi:hypothetical protein
MLSMLYMRSGGGITPPAQPAQLGAGAWGRGKRFTYGDLMDLWEHENQRIRALEKQAAINKQSSQEATNEAAEAREVTEIRKQLNQSRIRLLELEQERKAAEGRASISRMQAESLARQEKALRSYMTEMEEEEAIAMAMIALML